MSTPTNRVLVSVAPRTIFNDATNQTDSTVSYNQGDLLVFRLGLVQKAAIEGDASTFLGIAPVTVISGKLQSPYQGLATTSRESPNGIPGPVCGVIATLILKSGDALAVGAPVYADPSDGPEFVQSATSGTKIIGVYQGAAITGDGIKSVDVLLGSRYPADTLSF